MARTPESSPSRMGMPDGLGGGPGGGGVAAARDGSTPPTAPSWPSPR